LKVVNVKDYGGLQAATKAGVIYCGRPNPLGNPFRLDKFSREEAISNYRVWLYHQLINNNRKIISTLEELKEDSVLGCWCKPLACHCDIIIKAWYWWRNKNASKKM
jgi:hypothetical protein